MNKAFSYFRAQLLRARKFFPAVLLFALAVTACVGVLLSALVAQSGQQESKKKIKVGIVGDLSDSLLELGLFAVQNFDSSKGYLEFLALEEADALRHLEQGEITGYLLVPEGFVQTVMDGDDAQVEFVSGNSPSSLGPLFMQEVAAIVSDFVQSAQSGVYGFSDLARGKLENSLRNDLVNEFALSYTARILSRNDMLQSRALGFSRGLGFGEYYFCTFFLLTLLLCALPCAGLLIKTDLALPRLYRSRGGKGQILGEFIPYFLLLSLCSVLIFALLGLLQTGAETPLLPTVRGFGGYLLLALRLLPSVLLLAALQFFVYQLTDNLIGAVLLQTVVITAMAYACGLFFPLYSLPTALQTLSGYLPVGMAFRHASLALRQGGAGIPCLLYAGGLLLAAAGVRSFKLRCLSHDS